MNLIKIIWPEIENCFAGKTYSEKYLSNKSLGVEKSDLYFKAPLE